jgi:hypothetical protein
VDFDGTLAQLAEWIGSDVNVQVLGETGPVLNVEGVLGRMLGRDGQPISGGFTLDPDGASFPWLEREHHHRTLWANTAETMLLSETEGLAVTVQREVAS